MILFYYFFFLFPFLILSKDILSYNISYNKQIEEDLFLKLKDIRYPLYKQQKQQQKESNKEDNWKEGIPINIINELILYLKSNFNWKNQINKLNSFNQFQLEIENYQIHFIHYKSSYKNAKPLLFLHGWPGSFWECHKILPMLTEPQNYGGKIENSFHVICPSIPGYGYSSIPTENGFDQYKCAQIFSKLMLELNYSKYYIQGGDWGSVIGSLQASLPENYDRILGLHLNMVPVAFPFKKGFFPLISNLFSLILPWFFYTPYERQIITDLPLKTILETGYFHEQSTKPLTLSYGLSDSPVGLLAWIVEKFYVWSDVSTKDFFEVHSKDELLTNFMIYWTTNTACILFYYFILF